MRSERACHPRPSQPCHSWALEPCPIPGLLIRSHLSSPNCPLPLFSLLSSIRIREALRRHPSWGLMGEGATFHLLSLGVYVSFVTEKTIAGRPRQGVRQPTLLWDTGAEALNSCVEGPTALVPWLFRKPKLAHVEKDPMERPELHKNGEERQRGRDGEREKQRDREGGRDREMERASERKAEMGSCVGNPRRSSSHSSCSNRRHFM